MSVVAAPAFLLLAVATTVVFVACTSPESTRQRSGGRGGDTGNRGRVVQMHDGSRPYWSTPERLARDVGLRDLGSAQQLARADRAAPRP